MKIAGFPKKKKEKKTPTRAWGILRKRMFGISDNLWAVLKMAKNAQYGLRPAF